MAVIGIDLGTTNSLIAVFRNGKPELIPNALGAFLTPSVVSLYNKTLITGNAAKARLTSHPNETAAVFKRTMGAEKKYQLGKKKYSAEDLSAIVLRTLKMDAETYLGEQIEDAVISVPAYFNELQRKAVRAAAEIAGIRVQRLINEPTAAALAYGLNDIEDESTFLVFDLGGGTFDVSIIEIFDGVMEVKSTAGDAYLGGEDFSEALAKHLLSESQVENPTDAQLAIINTLAEQAKLGLTTEHEVNLKTVLGDVDFEATITRKQLEKICEDQLRRLRRPVERALHDAHLTRDEIERVVLVGGATRMPIVRGLAGKQLARMPEFGLNPDHVVALGAAVQAGLVGKDAALDDIVMTDVSAFTLGVDTARETKSGYRNGFFQPIIERNSVVPISREEVFSTLETGQRKVSFNIFQGEAPMVASNILLGQLEVSVPYNDKEHEAVSIRFTYDVSGLLAVDATVLSTQKKQSVIIKSLSGEMSESDIAKRLKALEKLKVHPREEVLNIHLRARIEQCYAMALTADREVLQNILLEFDQIVDGQNDSDIEVMRNEISEQLDHFEANYVR